LVKQRKEKGMAVRVRTKENAQDNPITCES
jgi:hypothetical protein